MKLHDAVTKIYEDIRFPAQRGHRYDMINMFSMQNYNNQEKYVWPNLIIGHREQRFPTAADILGNGDPKQ